ncbi:hypothetical protein [Desulfovibrio sp. UCD-KL4C]|uniref:hypothetical protein n=1 Tax=Desulfovibrio sp. UCD-KL4C TaxID=2578120 RepID=UPI0025C28F19|nr:hypothetical protein [Desulfovibrio sp. UCD-KL4C]
MQKDSGSFRDRSGYVYYEAGNILRTIMPCYKDTWLKVTESGFLDEALDENLIVSFEEYKTIPKSWKTLKVASVPFITYPYEWSFSQLKDAALLTLELQKKALRKGLTLKDASAYNVQFIGSRPTFIDIFSFEEQTEGGAWQGYGQFCSHFLAPLALAAKKDLRLAQLSRQWIDGIPIDIASSLLPWIARLSPSIFMHLTLHSALQKKYADPRTVKDIKTRHMPLERLQGIVESLEDATKNLHFPKQITEWGDYYNDTNYTEAATDAKLSIVESIGEKYAGKLAVDLGANTGRFSLPLSKYFKCVISADIDPAAVDLHYRTLRKNGPENILPIIMDLSSPSPSLGWATKERKSFEERCEADMLLALALCHHLFFTAGIPFQQISEFFFSLLRDDGVLICEYIPKEDSQVQRMLSARDDIFEDYNVQVFKESFTSAGFKELETINLPDSLRTLHVFKKNS